MNYPDDFINKIICGDCLEVMKDIPDNSIDLVVTDPPYFIPIQFQSVRSNRRNFVKKFADLSLIEHFFKDVFKELQRVIKLTGSMYVFCSGQSYPLFWFHLFQFCKSVRPLIWDKGTSITGFSWRHQHEIIIFAEMFNYPVIRTGDGDILKDKAVPVDKRLHPSEKPISLITKLISKSSEEGQIVLDPFIGVGSTAIVCSKLQRKFIGIEIDEEYCKIAEERLKKIPKRLDKFIGSDVNKLIIGDKG